MAAPQTYRVHIGKGGGAVAGWASPQLIAAVVTLIGVLVVGVINYRATIGNRNESRRQHEDEQAGQRTRLLTERFGKAAEQIGHDEPAVRLAGVYAMAALADEWQEQRQQCVDVLCGYMRLPPREQRGEDQVRTTIVSAIRQHLTKGAHASWSELDFDFRGANFPRGSSFAGATFAGTARFNEATFAGTVLFDETTFAGTAAFNRATFNREASFYKATFGGVVSFEGATFAGTGSFNKATFTVSGDFGDAVTREGIDLRRARIEDRAGPPIFVSPDGTVSNALPLIPRNWPGDDGVTAPAG